MVKKRDSSVENVSVTIDKLDGDNSGMVHSSQEMRVTVADGVVPFPTSLRVYDNSEMDLPPSEYGMHIEGFRPECCISTIYHA